METATEVEMVRQPSAEHPRVIPVTLNLDMVRIKVGYLEPEHWDPFLGIFEEAFRNEGFGRKGSYGMDLKKYRLDTSTYEFPAEHSGRVLRALRWAQVGFDTLREPYIFQIHQELLDRHPEIRMPARPEPKPRVLEKPAEHIKIVPNLVESEPEIEKPENDGEPHE